MNDPTTQAREAMYHVRKNNGDPLFDPLSMFVSLADHLAKEDDDKIYAHIILTYTYGVMDAVHNNLTDKYDIGFHATEFGLQKLKEKFGLEVCIVDQNQMHDAPETPQ